MVSRLPIGLGSLAARQAKTPAEPVRVFRVGGEPGRGSSPSVRRRPATIRAVMLIPAVLALIAAAGAAWWFWPGRHSEPQQLQAESTNAPVQPYSAPRLSSVVLPFAKLSDDPHQEDFVYVVTEDLTTDLARID